MIGIDGFHREKWSRSSSAPRLTVMVNGLVALILVSCSGGGGTDSNLQNNPSANYLASIDEPSSPAVAGDWSGSQEYANSTGLAQLKAAEGYARRSGGLPGGKGVKIAIIDSGIDVTHPDLGNLSSKSWTAGDEGLLGDSHATFVAGIAAASRTQSSAPNDMHGIAYRATLVNFQASRPSVTEAIGEITFSTDDLVDAIRTASGLVSASSAVESDVLNLSLGAFSNSDDTFAELRTAMRAAASEGKIMVLAAGNEGASSDPTRKLQPIYPAAYADDTGIAGFAIVVGNLTSTDGVAPSSNHCGDTQDYCLFAPGTNVQSTLNGGTYGVGSGTSFAAPYVSGAAAVVKAAFPGVSSRDVVDRLLLTAEDLGAAGVDSIFGRGRLDLEAAMAPVGPTGVPIGPTVDGPTLPLRGSTLQLGPGLAMNAAAKRLLGRTMAVDEMGFPFPVDLAKAAKVTRRDHGLSNFIGRDAKSVASAARGTARLSAFVPEDDIIRSADMGVTATVNHSGEEGETVPLSFTADVVDNATIFASLNGGSQARIGLEAGLAERRAPLMQTGSFLSPHDSLASASSGVGFGFEPADGTEIAVSAYTSIADQKDAETSMQRLEVVKELPGAIEVRLDLGLMQEEGGFLGGTTSGVFGDDASAQSQFLTLSLLGPLAERVDWFGTYSRGRSSIGKLKDGLVGNWSDTRSEAFGVGLVVRDLARVGDGFSVLVGQPFRQERAKATIELPVARREDGKVVTAGETLDFAPEAREVATELGYRLPLDAAGNQHVQAIGFLRLNPDHDPNRNPEAGAGLTYQWRF